MLLFYVDEFGTHDLTVQPGVEPPTLKAGTSDWFVLAAVGIHDASRKPLAEALFDLKQKHFGDLATSLPWGESEIKGRHVVHAVRDTTHRRRRMRPDLPKAYAALDDVDKATAFADELGLVFRRFRPHVLATVVDKRKLLATNELRTKTEPVPPLGAAYTFLWQRVSMIVEQLYSSESAIIVADQQRQHETFFTTGEMNRVRDRIASNHKVSPDFKLVLDKPLWIDTDLSVWDREIVQLADVVAYAVGEIVTNGAVPTEDAYLWEEIVPLLATDWDTGKIVGAGLTTYPQPIRWPALF